MGEALALVRAGWLSAMSYRLRLLFSLVALGLTVVPVYFVAGAIQPLIGDAIQTEGSHYFAFLLVGMATMFFLTTAVTALPSAFSGGINTGMLEAVLSTPARMPSVLLGMIGYDFSWTAVRAMVLVTAGIVLGAQFAWAKIPTALVILLLIILVHLSFGLVAAAMVLAFRTSSPISQGVIALSGFLGGVYYPTSVIPSWIQDISSLLPLTYGLRALRQTVLEGYPLHAVAGDILILAAFTVVLLASGSVIFTYALRYARRSGTLAQY